MQMKSLVTDCILQKAGTGMELVQKVDCKVRMCERKSGEAGLTEPGKPSDSHVDLAVSLPAQEGALSRVYFRRV